MQFGIDHLIGSALVAILAVRRFNTPPTNRSSTTALRYHLAQIGYCAFMAFAFLALSRSSRWLAFLGGGASDSGPIFAALLLVTLQSNAPVVREIDQWLRNRFHDFAAIPSLLDELTERMRRATPFIPEYQRAGVRNALRARGLEPDDAWFDEPRSPFFTLLRVVVLWSQLREQAPRRLERLGVSESHIRELDERYTALLEKAEAAASGACGRCHAAFQVEASAMFGELRRIAGQDVLRFQPSQRRRESRLEQLGFRLEPKQTLTLNQILGVCFAIFAIAFLAFFGVHAEGRELAFGTKLRIIVTIVISWMSILAVLHWVNVHHPDVCARDAAGGRPWGFYLLAALVSTALAQVTQFGVTLAFTPEASLTRGLEWRLLTFSGALLTAFHVHNPPRPGLRVFECVSEGVVMAAMAYFVTALFLPEVRQFRLGPAAILRSMTMNFLFGAVVGYFVPHWFRTSSRRLLARQSPHPGPAATPATGAG